VNGIASPHRAHFLYLRSRMERVHARIRELEEKELRQGLL